MNNLSEKEQLIIKTMIEDKIEALEKQKSQVKVALIYAHFDNQITDLRKILNKISK